MKKLFLCLFVYLLLKGGKLYMKKLILFLCLFVYLFSTYSVDKDARGKFYYFVLIDRWENGDTGNDYTSRDDHYLAGDGLPQSLGYWGGDIKGLLDSMTYFNNFGVDGLYITSPFDQPDQKFIYEVDYQSSNYHGYHNKDYKKLEEHYIGTGAQLSDLITALHNNNMQLIIDAVPNHGSHVTKLNMTQFIGLDSGSLYNNGADIVLNPEKYTGYNDFDVRRDKQQYGFTNSLQYGGNIAYGTYGTYRQVTPADSFFTQTITHNYSVKVSDWDGIDGLYGNIFDLVDWNQENPLVRQYIIDSYVYWLNQGVDGYRFDAIKHWVGTWGDLGNPSATWNHAKAYCDAMIAATGEPNMYLNGEWFGGDIGVQQQLDKGNTGMTCFLWSSQGAFSNAANGTMSNVLSYVNNVVTSLPNSYNRVNHFADNHDMARCSYTLDQWRRGGMTMALIPGNLVWFYGSEIRWQPGQGEPGNRAYVGLSTITSSANGNIPAKFSAIKTAKDVYPAARKGNFLNGSASGTGLSFTRNFENNYIIVGLNSGSSPVTFTNKAVSVPDGTYINAVNPNDSAYIPHERKMVFRN